MKIDPMLVTQLDKERREILDRIEAVQRLATEPGHNELSQTRGALANVALDTLSHLGKHGAAGKMLVAVTAPEVAVL
jgi:hypothetical protein